MQLINKHPILQIGMYKQDFFAELILDQDGKRGNNQSESDKEADTVNVSIGGVTEGKSAFRSIEQTTRWEVGRVLGGCDALGLVRYEKEQQRSGSSSGDGEYQRRT